MWSPIEGLAVEEFKTALSHSLIMFLAIFMRLEHHLFIRSSNHYSLLPGLDLHAANIEINHSTYPLGVCSLGVTG